MTLTVTGFRSLNLHPLPAITSSCMPIRNSRRLRPYLTSPRRLPAPQQQPTMCLGVTSVPVNSNKRRPE